MRLEEGWRPRTLESVLGPSHGRFFGEGYRGVRHKLHIAPAGTEGENVGWLAQVTYPTGWSRDEDGKSRRPHLSTVDAVVLPLMALSSLGRRDDAATKYERAYVSRIDLRAGDVPWLDLDAVPVSLHREESEAPMQGRGVQRFRTTTGNLGASIWIVNESPPGCPRLARGELIAADVRGVYDDLYRSTQVNSTLTAYEPERGRLIATHHFDPGGPPSRHHTGIESGFWPALSVVDYLVTLGQLSQALIQLRHGGGRAGTLWMRRMTIRFERSPEALPAIFESSMTIDRDHLIERHGRRYRNIVIDARTSNGVHIEARLAHEETR